MIRPSILGDGKNLVCKRVKELREKKGLSQSGLACALQLLGCDIDKNAVTRIETNKRYVTDMEFQALVEVFGVCVH